VGVNEVFFFFFGKKNFFKGKRNYKKILKIKKAKKAKKDENKRRNLLTPTA
jgi:hypothetical protein